jgi:hypothetical protein
MGGKGKVTVQNYKRQRPHGPVLLFDDRWDRRTLVEHNGCQLPGKSISGGGMAYISNYKVKTYGALTASEIDRRHVNVSFRGSVAFLYSTASSRYSWDAITPLSTWNRSVLYTESRTGAEE